MRKLAVSASLLTLPFVGCYPDDWDGSPYRPGSDDAPMSDTAALPGLVGNWRSEGGDLSPLFAGEPFHYEQVEADFTSAGTYVVRSTDRDGTTYVLTGTWTGDEGTEPATVRLLQTEPYPAEAEGLWQVDGDALTYEVVQTIPDYGFSPPIPAEGFGSTQGPGLDPGTNVQIYRRVP